MKSFAIQFSKARTIICGVLLLLSCIILVPRGLWQNAAVIAFLFVSLVPSSIQANQKSTQILVDIAWCFLCTVVTFLIVQLAIDASVHAVGLFRITLNLLLLAAVSLILFALTGRLKLSTLLCAGFFLIYAAIDFFVLKFRGREITPFDILTVRTAANVAAEFDFTPGLTLISALVMFFQLVVLSFSLPKRENTIGIKTRLGVLVLAIVFLATVNVGSRTCKSRHFGTAGAGINGSVLNFVLQLDSLRNDPPEGYSIEKVSQIEKQVQEQTPEGQEIEHQPDIIVIMDESFADLSILGSDVRTNQEITPFIDSLRENTVRGYALSSVYGGDTANSEFEFLTGNSMFFLPENTVPYQQYIKDQTYSIVSYLKGKGYSTLAMHPFDSSGWMRTTVYPLLGFDNYLFIDDFPQKDFVRNYVSDAEMFREVEKHYEQMTSSGDSAFIFGVTMQNHGGYDYTGNDFQTSISLEGYKSDYPDAEQYLSLIHETDTAVRQLIEYFQNTDREVVIVFFGDHLPGLSMDFYEEIHGGPFSSFDEEMQRYKIPFFIWTNYDIEETEVPLTSINYLSALMFDSCGMSIPHYQQFLLGTSATVPAMNSRGYYSMESGSFVEKEQEADSGSSSAENRALTSYSYLQYNNMFANNDQKSSFFFE